MNRLKNCKSQIILENNEYNIIFVKVNRYAFKYKYIVYMSNRGKAKVVR